MDKSSRNVDENKERVLDDEQPCELITTARTCCEQIDIRCMFL